MALAAGNVRRAVTGAIYVGPVGTAAPTSHNSVLNVAYKDLGYMSEDGISESLERSTDDIRAWQNAQIVRTTVTEAGITFTFTCIETKKETVETFYGSAVTDATGLITINAGSLGGSKAWVIDVIDGANIIRTYIAEGEVTDPGEVVYANGEAIGYEMTVTSYTQPMRWYSGLIV